MPLYYMWLEENISEEDLVDGAFYNTQNRQWVITDFERLKSWIYLNTPKQPATRS